MNRVFQLYVLAFIPIVLMGCASDGGRDYNDLADCRKTGEHFMIKRQKMQRDDFGPTMGVNDQVPISTNLPIECLEYYQ